MGLPAIANQTFRLLVHQRLKMAVQFWNEKYPGVDILLIEPELDDELMFGTSIMDYSSRLEVAAHGFESITARLSENYDEFKQITERHGLEISATRLRKVIRTVKEQEPTGRPAEPADRPLYFAESSSISVSYFSAMIGRLSLSVGVSSPSS